MQIETFKSYFLSQNEILRADLWKFYQSQEHINETTFNWRIHDLVNKGILERVGWGKYRIGKMKLFEPVLNEKKHIEIYELVQKEFPYSRFCIWHTEILNQFHLHLRGKHHLMIEIEADSLESAFGLLSSQFENVFLSPDKNILERYVLAHAESIIVKPLVFQAPIQQVNEKWTISLEKLIVDIYFEKNLFAMEQENEQHYLFQEMFNRYTVNQDRLMQYARRRLKDKKAELFRNWINYIQTTPYHD
jgi:hypothetical protein